MRSEHGKDHRLPTHLQIPHAPHRPMTTQDITTYMVPRQPSLCVHLRQPPPCFFLSPHPLHLVCPYMPHSRDLRWRQAMEHLITYPALSLIGCQHLRLLPLLASPVSATYSPPIPSFPDIPVLYGENVLTTPSDTPASLPNPRPLHQRTSVAMFS